MSESVIEYYGPVIAEVDKHKRVIALKLAATKRKRTGEFTGNPANMAKVMQWARSSLSRGYPGYKVTDDTSRD